MEEYEVDEECARDIPQWSNEINIKQANPIAL